MQFRRFSTIAVWVGLGLLGACSHSDPEIAPAPDARRPSLKSEAELAADRQARILSGAVTPGDTPTVAPEAGKAQSRPAAKPAAAEGGIRGDVLMVNQTTITVDEVLYALRSRLTEIRTKAPKTGAKELVEKLVRSQAQQDIGTALVYEEAMAKVEESQRKALERAVNKEIDLLAAREFEASSAKLSNHLERHGLTLEQFRGRLERIMVTRSYSQEMLLPRVTVRREDLFEAYRTNQEAYSTPATREMLVIEAPFQHFLPDDVSWRTASAQQKARARLSAVRHIREAHGELASGKPFAEVATSRSFGLAKEQGGSLGMIGKPLQAPLEDASKLVFGYNSGQFSEPIEMEDGWMIVGCGEVQIARTIAFEEAQEKIREDILQRRFEKLTTEYVLKLADKASILNLDAFVQTAARRALSPDWPRAAALSAVQ